MGTKIYVWVQWIRFWIHLYGYIYIICIFTCKFICIFVFYVSYMFYLIDSNFPWLQCVYLPYENTWRLKDKTIIKFNGDQWLLKHFWRWHECLAWVQNNHRAHEVRIQRCWLSNIIYQTSDLYFQWEWKWCLSTLGVLSTLRYKVNTKIARCFEVV